MGWPVFVICWFAADSAQANPVSFNPSSFLAFGFVAFGALVVEAGVVSLILTSAGIAPLRFFVGFFCANAAIFLFVFCPLLNSKVLPWFALEPLVVVLDSASIKVLSQMDLLQGYNYSGVRWRFAGVTALVGNAVSFFIGVIANGAPWISHD